MRPRQVRYQAALRPDKCCYLILEHCCLKTPDIRELRGRTEFGSPRLLSTFSEISFLFRTTVNEIAFLRLDPHQTGDFPRARHRRAVHFYHYVARLQTGPFRRGFRGDASHQNTLFDAEKLRESADSTPHPRIPLSGCWPESPETERRR